jgi:predicted RNA-binding Zn-ribbon protein involved in translation (DUF1610 family)
MEANSLDPIRYQINAGDQRGARLALVDLLEAEPDNANAWALLAILLTDPAEQAQCYREILRINPNDRQAEIWLESLTGQAIEQPTSEQLPAQGPSGRSCPRCGSIVKAGPLLGSQGRHTICPHCGFHIDPSDLFEGREPTRADEQLPSKESPGLQPTADRNELDRILEEVALPGADEELQQPPRVREIRQRQVEPKGFLDGVLGRLQGRSADPDPEVEALVLGQEDVASAAGALSPELILRLAGGPLAPEERRNCPQCDAVVSRREAKCPWCSAPLPNAKGG